MNKIAYYHTYLTDNSAVWSSIIMEQFKVMEDSGLIGDLDVMNVTAITQRDDRMDKFVRLCESFGFNKLKIQFIQNTLANDADMLAGRETNGPAITEIPTFKKMWDDCQTSDDLVLYFHSKAMTAHDKFFDSGNIEKYKQNVYWRHYLNWGALDRWKDCIKELDKYDMSGVNYRTDPIPHYSGSFWWANSSHIRRLPNPETVDWWYDIKANTKDQWLRTCPIRYKDEHWATHLKDTKMFNIEGSKNNPAFVTTPRRLYI